MAKKKGTEEEVKVLKLRVQEKKAVIGADLVLKSIRNGSLKRVFLASNCPAQTKEDVLHYAKLASIPVVELNYNNEEIGIFCKKNFLVSVLGLTSE